MITSCLEGIMGRVRCWPGPDTAVAAAADLGDFTFLAGTPSPELILPEPDFRILVPGNSGWQRMIETVCGPKARQITRYAFYKDFGCFDRENLGRLAGRLPEGFTLRKVDRERYNQCRKESWSRDFVAQYPTWEAYSARGLGFVAEKNGRLVSGASSYSAWSGGIEIEVDTHPEFRRRGLATACAAALILECLNRGLYPSWDAANLWSVSLAQKLGYRLKGAYTAYEITGASAPVETGRNL